MSLSSRLEVCEARSSVQKAMARATTMHEGTGQVSGSMHELMVMWSDAITDVCRALDRVIEDVEGIASKVEKLSGAV